MAMKRFLKRMRSNLARRKNRKTRSSQDCVETFVESGPHDGPWASYPRDVKQGIRAAYRRGFSNAEFTMNGKDYRIDFGAMRVVDIESGEEREFAFQSCKSSGTLSMSSTLTDHDTDGTSGVADEMRSSAGIPGIADTTRRKEATSRRTSASIESTKNSRAYNAGSTSPSSSKTLDSHDCMVLSPATGARSQSCDRTGRNHFFDEDGFPGEKNDAAAHAARGAFLGMERRESLQESEKSSTRSRNTENINRASTTRAPAFARAAKQAAQKHRASVPFSPTFAFSSKVPTFTDSSDVQTIKKKEIVTSSLLDREPKQTKQKGYAPEFTFPAKNAPLFAAASTTTDSPLLRKTKKKGEKNEKKEIMALSPQKRADMDEYAPDHGPPESALPAQTSPLSSTGETTAKSPRPRKTKKKGKKNEEKEIMALSPQERANVSEYAQEQGAPDSAFLAQNSPRSPAASTITDSPLLRKTKNQEKKNKKNDAMALSSQVRADVIEYAQEHGAPAPAFPARTSLLSPAALTTADSPRERKTKNNWRNEAKEIIAVSPQERADADEYAQEHGAPASVLPAQASPISAAVPTTSDFPRARTTKKEKKQIMGCSPREGADMSEALCWRPPADVVARNLDADGYRQWQPSPRTRAAHTRALRCLHMDEREEDLVCLLDLEREVEHEEEQGALLRELYLQQRETIYRMNRECGRHPMHGEIHDILSALTSGLNVFCHNICNCLKSKHFRGDVLDEVNHALAFVSQVQPVSIP